MLGKPPGWSSHSIYPRSGAPKRAKERPKEAVAASISAAPRFLLLRMLSIATAHRQRCSCPNGYGEYGCEMRNSNPTPGGQSGRSHRFVGVYSQSGKRNRRMQNPSGKRNRLAWKLQSGGPTATLQETTTRADDDHNCKRCNCFNGRSTNFGGALRPMRPTPHLNCPTSQLCLMHIFLHHSSEKGGFTSNLPDPARYIFIKYRCSELDHVKYS